MNIKAKNILCCCAYSHPSFNHVRFKEHFETILSQLSRENKNIFLTGEFNINLLNCESHPESNNFLLILNSYFLLPYSLQPTHITIRSATLINNIDCQWFESYAEYWLACVGFLYTLEVRHPPGSLVPVLLRRVSLL